VSESPSFNIIQTVATGGTAVLFKAVQVSLDRVVAVKRLHPHLTQDENFTRRFVLEAKAAASLDHENIVRVIDFGVESGSYQMVMEFVEGESLKEVLERWRPITPELALALAHQILRGLEHAHSKGIVHRDIKPGNVMLTKGGVAKITDFGLAKLTQGNTVQTAADSILGTPLYMSPEQAFGESVDQRSDLFSLGTMLYELLTGRQPFASENYMGVIQNIIHGRVPSLKEINPRVPPAIDALVMKALAKNREERFQSARTFRKAVEAVLGLEGLSRATAELPLLLERDIQTRVLPRAKLEKGSTSAAWSSKSAATKHGSHGGLWATMIVVALVMGGAGWWFLWPRARSTGASSLDPAPGIQQATVADGVLDFIATPLSTPDSASIATTDTSVAATSAPESTLAHAAATTAEPGGPSAPPAMPWRAESPSKPANDAGASDKPQNATTTEAAPSAPVEAAKTEPKNEPVERPKRDGYLTLEVEPLAQVYVNGTYRGDASPTLRLTLPAGAQTIECRYPKHEPYTETLRIVAGEMSRRTIILKKLKGVISLSTQEGAEFFVDGEFIGTTPIRRPIEVPAGTHALMIKKLNYFTWTSEVMIEANETLPLHITLSPRY
jgi:serine/threonine protein kinase